MNIVERMEEWWLVKIPAAITWSVKFAAWVVLIFPFIAIGYASNKVAKALMTGWIISRDFD